MGNASSAELHDAVQSVRNAQRKGVVSPYATSAFATKVDYTDESLQSRLPSGFGGSLVNVSCLICPHSLSAARLQSVEQGSKVLRSIQHPNLFRVVAVSQSSTNDLSVIGVPKVSLLSFATIEEQRIGFGEVVWGLCGALEALQTLTNVGYVLPELYLHQFSMEDGRRGGGELCHAEAIHHGRWILHDLSTAVKYTTPQQDSSRSSATTTTTAANSETSCDAKQQEDFGPTLRSIALLLLECLAAVRSSESMSRELASALQHSCVLSTDGASSAAGAGSRPPRADAAEQLLAGSVTNTSFPTLNDAMLQLQERAPSTQPSDSGGDEDRGPVSSRTVVAMRTLESSMEDLLRTAQAMSSPEDGSDETTRGSGSSGSRSRAPSVPNSVAPSSGGFVFQSEVYSSAAEAIVQWLHLALFQSAHTVYDAHSVFQLLGELRALLAVKMDLPIPLILHHGSQLYLRAAEDQVGADGDRCHVLRAYEAIQRATARYHHTLHAAGGATVWERCVLTWLSHPSHVAQPAASTLFDYIFETISTGRPLLTPHAVTVVALRWLRSESPSCRGAALRYAKVLMRAIPTVEVVRFLTTSGFILFQARALVEMLALLVSQGAREEDAEEDTRWIAFLRQQVSAVLRCARRYVDALPHAAAVVLAPVDATSLAPNQGQIAMLLQTLIVKELVLLLEGCGALPSHDSHLLAASGVSQEVDRLSRRCLTTLMFLGSNLPRAPPSCFPASLYASWQAVSFGSVESRERALHTLLGFILASSEHQSSLLRGESHSVEPTTSQTTVTVPLQLDSIVKCWVPMLTPLCGVQDAVIRRAACGVVQELVRALQQLQQAGKLVSSNPSASIATFLSNALQKYEADLHDSHSEGLAQLRSLVRSTWESSKMEPLSQRCLSETALLSLFTACYGKRLYASACEAASAEGTNWIPSKDFLNTQEGRSLLWVVSLRSRSVEGELLPQPYY